MSISPFFRNLRTAYLAEMDDLKFDSDGRDVLRQRLSEKRKEIAFLAQMIELSPEMVAVIFHQGFTFRQPALMEQLLSQEPDDFLQWSSLSQSIDLAPWAESLADVILQAPGGEQFMAAAAALHYMTGKPEAVAAQRSSEAGGDEDRHEGEDEDDANDDGQDQDQDEFDADEEGDAPGDSRARQEAGADWMVGQGFDRKD